MIGQGLFQYMRSLSAQRLVSHAATIKLWRFMRTGQKTEVDLTESLTMAGRLQDNLERATPISADNISIIKPPLSSVIAVAGLPFSLVAHSCLVVDTEPETIVAFATLRAPVSRSWISKSTCWQKQRTVTKLIYFPQKWYQISSDLISIKIPGGRSCRLSRTSGTISTSACRIHSAICCFEPYQPHASSPHLNIS
jgi:hypothetical protein